MPVSANSTIQTDYLPGGDFPPGGARWRSSSGSVAERLDTACIDARVLNKGVFEIQVTAATNAENWHINYDGVLIPFTTTAAVNSTATAIRTALLTVFGPGKALEKAVESGGVTVDADTVTIEFVDGTDHTITMVDPGGTSSTFTADWTADGVPTAPVDHKPGLWVCYDTTFDPQCTRIKEPSSTSDRVLGIAVLEGAVSPDSDALSATVDNTPVWPHGRSMSTMVRGQIVGFSDGEVTASQVGAPVYCVVTGARAGWCTTGSGGVSQVTRGDVVYNGTDAVGLTVDGYTVSVASATSDDVTAAALMAKWNGDGTAIALATATIDLSGTESYIILTFKDFSEHTVVAYSPATADVTGITNTTAAVAQTAILTNSKFLTPAADGERVAINVFEG